MIFLALFYGWFSLGGFIVAKQMGVTKPRELLAWTLLFLPIVFITAMNDIIETLFVLIERGWKGLKERKERDMQKAIEEMFTPLVYW